MEISKAQKTFSNFERAMIIFDKYDETTAKNMDVMGIGYAFSLCYVCAR